MISESFVKPDQIGLLSQDEKIRLERVVKRYPMFINSYYYGLIKDKGDPIYLQSVPDIRELDDEGKNDPLSEESMSPVPNLVHRYPDRVLFLVSNRCAMYCRFCTRKRKVGKKNPSYPEISERTLEMGFNYIEQHDEIRDVILSGGDPLMLSDESIDYILMRIRRIKHVEIIRIGTRIPCTYPMRITEKLSRIIQKYHPVYINTHFNHPRELTEEARIACEMLADHGIPLGNQTVLLKGVNDSVETMKALFTGLLKIRVRPYYMFQMDLVKGTSHFRTDIEKGIEILNGLIGWTSGLAIPHFIIDTPTGGGKVPLVPNYIVGVDNGEIVLKNYKGELYRYPYKGNQ
ncbi:MAG: KamA family radical SAM protein [Proteobacteria bacterium]|nr:KamA family radical SAM protein [Pseudomonadota bacterium]